VSWQICHAMLGLMIVASLLAGCTKGYNFSEAVYSASQTQN